MNSLWASHRFGSIVVNRRKGSDHQGCEPEGGFKMRRILSAVGAALALGLVVAMIGPASAAVTFDPETGTGFVGKGDVQMAFGWNNKAIQDNAGGVYFTYGDIETKTQECVAKDPEDTQGQPTWIVVDTRARTRTVGAEVAYDARENSKGKNGPLTGFLLTGFGDALNGGWSQGWEDDPNNGCPAGSHPRGAPTSTFSLGALTAHHGTASHVIWTAPTE